MSNNPIQQSRYHNRTASSECDEHLANHNARHEFTITQVQFTTTLLGFGHTTCQEQSSNPIKIHPTSDHHFSLIKRQFPPHPIASPLPSVHLLSSHISTLFLSPHSLATRHNLLHRHFGSRTSNVLTMSGGGGYDSCGVLVNYVCFVGICYK
jgi:hypothetical protein